MNLKRTDDSIFQQRGRRILFIATTKVIKSANTKQLAYLQLILLSRELAKPKAVLLYSSASYRTLLHYQRDWNSTEISSILTRWESDGLPLRQFYKKIQTVSWALITAAMRRNLRFTNIQVQLTSYRIENMCSAPFRY